MGEGHPLCTFLKGPGAPPSDCGKRLHGSNEKGTGGENDDCGQNRQANSENQKVMGN